MIDQIQTVSVPVSDQEISKGFYVETLGFEVVRESEFGEGMRWIEVAPKEASASITLVTWFESMPPGSLQGLVVATDDIHKTHAELAGGAQAVFRDPDGNGLVLWERG